MKNKISKLVFALVAFVFFIANITLPALSVNAQQQEEDELDPDFETCYWQVFNGNEQSPYTEFCGYEVHLEQCTCGDFR